MINMKSADLTNPAQKAIALGIVGAVLLFLWWVLPPLIVILTNLWLAGILFFPLAFLIYNYQAVWNVFKRMSWNMTKKLISSDRLWYLWQGYNYLVSENEKMNNDIKQVIASRIESERTLATIAQDANRTKELATLEKNATKLRVLEIKVNMLNKQFETIEPKVEAAKQMEADLKDYYENRVADTEILKISLDGKAQEYELYKKMSKSADNAARWMKDSNEMRSFNESLKQIDESLDTYTANIEDFRRNVLPKMASNSTSRQLDAQEGAKLIEQYKKDRLLLTQ